MAPSVSQKPVAIVTGASAGIGEAIVRRFAAGGYRVVPVARRQEKLDQLARELGGASEIAPVATDVAAKDGPTRAVETAMKTFGRLDCLINNAGPSSWGPILDTDDALLDQVLDVSLKAAFRFSREALRVMGDGSSITSVGSVWGLVSGMGGGIYSTVKAGLIGLTQAIAADHGPLGVRANLVAPSVVRTGMTDAYWELPFFQRTNQEMTPSNRECTVDDVSNLCYFLASKEAGFINGQTIALDGGWSTTKYLSQAALMAERVKK